MSSFFFDPSGTLRSGWRLAVFAAMMAPAGAASQIAAAVLLTALMAPEKPGRGIYLHVTSLFNLIAALFVGWLCGFLLERLPFRALGAWFTRFWLSHFVQGCLIGVATIGIAVAVAAAGGLRFEANPAGGSAIVQSLLLSLAVFAVAAAFEEALFRGYILQTFARSNLAWLAVLMTSAFFGLAHASNPGATPVAVLNTVLAGVWFGVAYLKTRDLWFVWALHLVWNWLQGSVFGIEVSGLTDLVQTPLLKELDSGPVWLTGGSYGLEGGLACTFALALSTVAIHLAPFLRRDEELLEMTSPKPSHAVPDLVNSN